MIFKQCVISFQYTVGEKATILCNEKKERKREMKKEIKKNKRKYKKSIKVFEYT